MTNMNLLLFFTSLFTVILLGQFGLKYNDGIKLNEYESVEPDSTFDSKAALNALRAKIEGRENEPSEAVFENIQILNNIPAGRLLSIMDRAFNNSLGVSCDHCHNPDSWESDEKPTKQITRDMWDMVKTINQELLTNIDNLQSDSPVVNCTVCHRGEIKPRLSMN